METTAPYTSMNTETILRIGRQQAIERWASLVSSTESILKTQGMDLDKLLVGLRKAIQLSQTPFGFEVISDNEPHTKRWSCGLSI